MTTLLTCWSVGRAASADPLPSTCRGGLVVGVSDADAQDVVAAVCSAVHTRNVSGVVRVSVVGANPRVRVGVARLVDTSTPEDNVSYEAADVAGAVRMAPAIVDSFAVASAPPAPPSSSAPSAVQTTKVVEIGPEEDRPPATPSSELATKPPTKAAGMVGVHAAAVVAGVPAVGGGGSVGIDHRTVQGFADATYGATAIGGKDAKVTALTMGARVKLSHGHKVTPVIGGGWSYLDYTARTESNSTVHGDGIGIFGESGVLVEIAPEHQVFALGRLNLGLYRETTPSAMSSFGDRNGSESTWTTALLAGYAYVFR